MASAADPKISEFLNLVHRQVVKLGPRDYLMVERLLRQGGKTWRRGELRAALASVLARDPEQWQGICRLYDAFVPEKETSDAPGAELSSDPGLELSVSRPETRRQAWKRRVRDGWTGAIDVLRNAPRGWWVAGIAGAFAVILGVLVYSLAPTPPAKVPVVVVAPVSVDPPSAPEAEFHLVRSTRQGLNTALGIDLVTPPPAEPLLLLALALCSFLLWITGVRFLELPARVLRTERLQLEKRQAASHEERKALDTHKAATGGSLQVRYRVECVLPVARKAVLDSAELLGRLYRQAHGVDLDTDKTLDRTVAKAGRFSPALEIRNNRQDILLLVDVEEGNHPWLDAFLRLAAAWQAQGIVFRRFDFEMSPNSVRDVETGISVQLKDLARQTEGLPLIIMSRQLDPHGRTGKAGWLSALAAWPRKAWLDPDPRSLRELAPARRRLLKRFEALGLFRFHMSDPGIVLLARRLAGSDAVSATEPDLPRLPGLDAEATAEQQVMVEALRKWALAASLVPDPNWDQLDAIRRYFPELRSALPEPWYLQRLLEWVERETQAGAELGGGRGLAIPPRRQDLWLRRQRRIERQHPDEPSFERRVRLLLLDQLGATEPGDRLDRQWWRFKRSMHQAMLEPRRAAELLGWIHGSAIAPEAVRVLRQELDREHDGIGAGFTVADVETLRALEGRADGVPLQMIVAGRWWRNVAEVALVAVHALVLFFFAQSWILGLHAIEAPVEVQPAAIYELVESKWPTGLHMIPMTGGVFNMGSDQGSSDSDERPVHAVKVAGFEISKTEVTVAQYEECVEANVCETPEPFLRECNWGNDGRDDHPMNCVSWTEARQFAQWLGLRLPSESEWEYAARSGGLDRQYPWGDEVVDCEHAVVDDGAVNGCGLGGTWPVCSKLIGNTGQGLCDMAGNVWEWVEDDWHGDYSDAPKDERAWIEPQRASLRVVRGGSWRQGPRRARVTSRGKDVPANRDDDLGFRVVRSVGSRDDENR